MSLKKLDDVLKIEDKIERQNELVAYAQSLKVNLIKAKNKDGQYDEDELTVLIFDAEQNRSKSRFQNIGAFVAAFIVLGIMMALIAVFVFFL